jgi:hypothetical protein
MPINTAALRRSAAMSIMPIPDGAFDTGDRQQAAWIYRGILAATPVVTARRVHAVISDVGMPTAAVTD